MEPGSLNWVMGALGAVWAAAIAVLVWAWRGRRVGDHPYCVGCGFDLVGMAESEGAGSRDRRCSECGADVGARGAVVVGERVRRKGWLVGAGVVNGIMLVGLATVAVGIARGVDWIKYEPTSWVGGRLKSTIALERMRGYSELKRRLSTGAVDKARALALADELLARQGDLEMRWEAEEAYFLVLLRSLGVLDDERMKTFARQAVSYRVEWRRRVRQGDAWPAVIWRADRGANGGALSVVFQGTIVVPGGKEARASGGVGDILFSSGNGSGGRFGRELGLAALPEGMLAATMRVDWEVFEGPATGISAMPGLVKMSRTYPMPVEVVGVGQEDVTPIRQDGLAEKVRASIRGIRLKPRGADMSVRDMTVDWRTPPADIVMQSWLRQGNEEFKGPAFVVKKGEQTTTSTLVKTPAGLSGKVDVVFRPEPELARKTTDVFAYADVEVVVKDVDLGMSAVGVP